MGLIELIRTIGEENISVQMLSECQVSATASLGKPTQITFKTMQVHMAEIASGNFTSVGMIIWIPKEKFGSIAKQLS